MKILTCAVGLCAVREIDEGKAEALARLEFDWQIDKVVAANECLVKDLQELCASDLRR